MDDAICLRGAPEYFLKSEWTELVTVAGSVAKALEALSHPEPGIIVFARREVIKGGKGGMQSFFHEQRYLSTRQITADFQKLAATGEIIAKGIYAGTGLHQDIPPELWPDMAIDFEKGTISSGPYSYSHVTVRRNSPTGFREDIIPNIVAWLESQRSQVDEEPKKVLAAAAREQFKGTYTERAFNTAYSRVYGRPRGRPRSQNK